MDGLNLSHRGKRGDGTPWSLLLLAGISLLLGVTYYVLFRGFAPALFNTLISDGLSYSADPTLGSLPSFIQTLSLTLIVYAVVGRKMQLAHTLSVCVLVCAWLAEPLYGVYSVTDLVAAGLGSCVAWSIALSLNTPPTNQRSTKRQKTVGITAVICASWLMTSASYWGGPSFGESSSSGGGSVNKPVYLSYSELRSSVKQEGPRSIESLGRLYLFGNYIYLNKRNQGIHIIDNSDPSNPVNLHFIAIPGNTEINIRDNYLYADSYVDLVTLDLNNTSSITEINRQQDVFPWDEYQNVPDSIWLDYNEIDESRGVVVGYE